ncbi:hypothetical protein PN416_15705 [Halorubrum ezzemoulense]|uniref:hypothetical protein n=1 Tax=Halorubrum ezzemoulense TaxID=337243 RepID=UPI00232E17E9|nr:hypothetical protein [Halorubrum ezzemoulense]MDB9281046.1 hypothetical protein [Halorubrum ezzemoulense]MDB9284850.1 hypothetical protein [Halorubrum ezzemoulense]
MAEDDVRHPVIVDTDALIAVANTGLWSRITDNIQLTTTNVCYHELNRHVREMSEYAPEGTRERWVHDGSKRALEPFDDEETSFTTVSCVPRPHGEDAGEKSVKIEIEQNTELYRFAILMDTYGRRAINRVFDDAEETTGKAVAPTFLLYLLLDDGGCTVAEFCQACGEILQGEGWTGYKAIQAAWEAIPVDCSQYLPDNLS